MTIALGKACQVTGYSLIFASRQSTAAGRSVSTASAIKQGIRRSSREPRARTSGPRAQEDSSQDNRQLARRPRAQASGSRAQEDRSQYTRSRSGPEFGKNFSRNAGNGGFKQPGHSPSSGQFHGKSGALESRPRDSERALPKSHHTRSINSEGRLAYGRKELNPRARSRQHFSDRTPSRHSDRSSKYGLGHHDRSPNDWDDPVSERRSQNTKHGRDEVYRSNRGPRDLGRPKRKAQGTINLSSDVESEKSEKHSRTTRFDSEDREGHDHNDRYTGEPMKPSTRALGPRTTRLSIQHTTPASEFLYGTSVVTAALKSKRRKVYKLYLYMGDDRSAVPDATLRSLARSRGIETTIVRSDGLSLMDKMSGGRPHNVGSFFSITKYS